MKVTVLKKVEAEISHIVVKAKVRYWQDSEVNDIEDTDGDLIPCREGEHWCPIIDINTGKITTWPQGMKAKIHYKVCDGFHCEVMDKDGVAVIGFGGYVRNFMCPKEEGYGDYIIMDIDENGMIKDWKFTEKDFHNLCDYED